MPSWLVRRFRASEDFGAITELGRAVYPEAVYPDAPERLSRDKAYLNWKYADNPQGTYMAVCEAEGKIVGFQALIPILVKVDGALSRWAWGGDLMVHPQFRRQGIFLAIKHCTHEEAKRDISVVFGAGSLKTPTSRGILKYLGYEHLSDVPRLKRYLSPLSTFRSLSIQGKITVGNLGNYLGSVAELISITLQGNLLNTLPSRQSNHTYDEGQQIHLREIKPFCFGSEFDRLWNEVNKSLPIAVVRSKEYLNWRYANPCATYVGFRADKDGCLCGYSIIAYGTSGKLKIAWVADLLAKKPTISSILLRECLRRAKEDNANVVIMYDNRELGNLSRSLGLVRAWRKNPMVAYLDDPKLPRDLIGDINNWYVTVGDTDDWI